jgi:L-asparaginase
MEMSIKTIVQSSMLVAGLVAGASALSGTNAWAADVAQEASTTPAAGTPRILVLATGGTISGTADPRSAIGYNSGNVLGQDLVRGVPGIEKLANISAEQISNVGSQDMSDKIWFQLEHRIREAFDAKDLMLASLQKKPFSREEWLFELKYK